MAGADYYSCDKCGRKTYYDAEVDYDGLGSMAALCEDCDKTHAAIIVERSQVSVRLAAEAVVQAAEAYVVALDAPAEETIKACDTLYEAVLAHRKAKEEASRG